MISVICIIVGVILLFVPQIQLNVVCYVFCAILIIAGIFAILRFYKEEGFKEIDNYYFSLGLFLIFTGCVGLIKANDIIGNLSGCIGMISLILGILILQGMVQLKAMNTRLWIVEAVLSVVTLCGSSLTLIGFSPLEDAIYGFDYYVFTISGVLSLVSFFIVWSVLKVEKRKENKTI